MEVYKYNENTNSELLYSVISAHGGLDLWNQIESIIINFRICGNILLTRGKSPFWRKLKVTVRTKEITTILEPFPRNGFIGIFHGDHVRIQNHNETTVYERGNERFFAARHILWDDLDLLYFLGYALWNYALTPFLFLWPGVHVSELQPISKRGKILRRLEVSFPKDIPTHCPKQVFYFNENGLLERLDYNAEIFGKLAKGAHLCKNYQEFSGYKTPTHRKVIPCYFGKTIPYIQVMEGWIDDVVLSTTRSSLEG